LIASTDYDGACGQQFLVIFLIFLGFPLCFYCRPRFAISAMLRCADLLLCNDQIAVAAKRLEEALQSGLLAPVAAYILAQPGAGAVVTTSSGGHAGLIRAIPRPG
jgi:hypothetical protein